MTDDFYRWQIDELKDEIFFLKKEIEDLKQELKKVNED